MYAKCGDLMKAKEVLEGLPVWDVVTWNALISGYVHGAHAQEALVCFERMVHEGMTPDAVTYICILKACGRIRALETGKAIHFMIARQGLLETDVLLGNTLLDMYVKCDALAQANEVVEGLPLRDAVSWNTVITGQVQGDDHGKEALNCFERMKCEGLLPDSVTFICILKACGCIGTLTKGQKIHSEILSEGLLPGKLQLGGALVDMYARCGALERAKEVLLGLAVRDVVSWSALIAGYVKVEDGKKALNCFECMQSEGISPNTVTFICILKACGSIGLLGKGESVHHSIVEQQLQGKNVILDGAVVDMYAKCGAVKKAEEVLEGLPIRNVVMWSTVITAYVQAKYDKEALKCFDCMRREGFVPDSVTFACILKACGSLGALDKGKSAHMEIVRQGLLGGSLELGNALVDMYAKCGALSKAEEVLEEFQIRDVVSWSALIRGYTHGEQSQKALNCFECMQHEGIFPDVVTFTCILKACSSVGTVDKGQIIHSEIVKRRLLSGNAVLGSALVDMYARCGAPMKAKEVLEEIIIRDVVSWNALITGYVDGELYKEALDFFEQMQNEGIFPDIVTFALMLKVCGSVGALEKGRRIHFEIIRQGILERSIMFGGAVVDMYAKCGLLTKAKEVLEGLLVQDIISWNALIAGYAQGEHGKEALNCFETMLQEGFHPDEITFLCVLSACGHSGLSDEGQNYFFKMSLDYDIVPESEHESCMINLFCRIGLFDVALAIFKKQESSVIHTALFAVLSACMECGNAKLGRWAFEHALQLDTEVVVPSVCISAGIGRRQNIFGVVI